VDKPTCIDIYGVVYVQDVDKPTCIDIYGVVFVQDVDKPTCIDIDGVVYVQDLILSNKYFNSIQTCGDNDFYLLVIGCVFCVQDF